MGLGAAVALMLAPWKATAQGRPGGAPIDEHELKAAFVYNLTRFASWPPEAFAAPDAPIVACVLGHDPIAAALSATLAGRTAHGRRFEVRRLPANSRGDGCHFAYVADESSARLAEVASRFRSRPVLTIGDGPGLPEAGGIAGLERAGNRLRLAINPAAARSSGLGLSSRLLGLARLVGGEPPAGRP
jgi:hypothetical protein